MKQHNLYSKGRNTSKRKLKEAVYIALLVSKASVEIKILWLQLLRTFITLNEY